MILGTDVSFWEDNNSTPQKINFKKMYDAGARFTIIKSSQNMYADEDFKDFWIQSKDSGLQRGIFHFYEYRSSGASPTNQANYLLDLCKGDFGELGLELDFERPNASWPELPDRSRCLDIINEFCEIIEQHTKEPTIFYSNYDFLKSKLLFNFPNWLKLKPLHLAQYPYATFDYIPADTKYMSVVPGWAPTFWQFTDRLDGLKYGCEAKQVDGDFYLGEDIKTFRKREHNIYLPIVISESSTEEKIEELTERIERLENIAASNGWKLN